MFKLVIIFTVYSMTPDKLEIDYSFDTLTGCYAAGAYHVAEVQNKFFPGMIPDSVKVEIICDKKP